MENEPAANEDSDAADRLTDENRSQVEARSQVEMRQEVENPLHVENSAQVENRPLIEPRGEVAQRRQFESLQEADIRAEAGRAGILGWLVGVPARILIGMVRVYQYTLSPIIGRQCRFEPTCSNYFIGSVRKYGAIRGAWRGTLRICRCHPLHPGGYDPP